MKKILVTGASGFIGKSICKNLANLKYSVCGTIRKSTLDFKTNDFIRYVSVGDMSLSPDWQSILPGYECVIHCAGKAHSFNDNNNKTLEDYRLNNAESTKKIAIECAKAGVKRFIFLSSIGVLGLNTNNRKPFLFSDEPNPIENYAVSKYEAEKALFDISKKTGLEVVVLRLPFVYGPSCPGNINRLIKIIRLRLPLPFSLVKNKRSFLGIDNLISIIIRCIHNSRAKNKIFLVSDDQDISIVDLLKYISSSMRSPLTLFPMPNLFLKFFALIINRNREIERLIGSLQIDCDQTKKILNWQAPLNVEEGIRRMIQEK